MLTITTESAFGIRWRTISRVRVPPIIRAATTKSRTRSVSTSPRTSRDGTCQEKRPMIRLCDDHRGAAPRRQHEHDEEERNRQQDVDEAHQHRVDEAAGEPGERSVERPDHRRDERGEEADLERRLAAEHDPAELVEAVVVGAEQVAAARRGSLSSGFVSTLVRVVDERPDEAEEHEEDAGPRGRRSRAGC